jgi:AcrR family transcriptional regulator
MIMAIEKETEEKIFNAAQNIFQKRGFEGARMQEIADEAKINKSMLHYYYRSKDKLFLKVFQVGVKKIFPKLLNILGTDVPLKEKVVKVVNFYHNMFWMNQHLPAFVIYEMNQHPERFKEFISSLFISIPPAFKQQVKEGIAKGEILPMEPEQFLMNIVSLCMMPMVAKTMVQTLFSLDEKAYSRFLEERKKLIPQLVMREANPS